MYSAYKLNKQGDNSAYNWEQIKFHLQNIHDNASLNVYLLQKQIFETSLFFHVQF